MVTVEMSVGTSPFTIWMRGNESPLNSNAFFTITTGMLDSGAITPYYDITTFIRLYIYVL